MKKALIVFGTRPEAIKMAPVIRELQKRVGIETRVCVSGQHREMLNDALRVFEIFPDFSLDVMRDGQTLERLTCALLEGIGRVLDLYRPDIVLVHGDTTTAFTASLSAFYRGIPIAHVEAGLRTESIDSPFPEELNRRVISQISSLDFAPTREAAERLWREGKAKERIYVTGNTAIDALCYTVKKEYTHPLLEKAKGKRLLLVTSHRRENIGEPMERIFSGIRRALTENENLIALFPMHKNPVVREIAHRVFDGCERITLTEPLGVFDMHNVMARAYAVVTDSGGIQEEAAHLGVPALVIRDNTERQEGVKSGAIRLIGTNEDSVYKGISDLLSNSEEHRMMSSAPSPFGKGNAGALIADAVLGVLSEK